MKTYNILVTWLEWLPKRKDYTRKSKWVRGVKAVSLTEASNTALVYFQGKICPKVSMGWYV